MLKAKCTRLGLSHGCTVTFACSVLHRVAGLCRQDEHPNSPQPVSHYVQPMEGAFRRLDGVQRMGEARALLPISLFSVYAVNNCFFPVALVPSRPACSGSMSHEETSVLVSQKHSLITMPLSWGWQLLPALVNFCVASLSLIRYLP